jgi:hypothetical protein
MSDILDVPAVRERDLRAILEQYGLADAVDSGSKECAACSTRMTWSSIGALLVKNRQLVLFCDDSDCLNTATQIGQE